MIIRPWWLYCMQFFQSLFPLAIEHTTWEVRHVRVRSLQGVVGRGEARDGERLGGESVVLVSDGGDGGVFFWRAA